MENQHSIYVVMGNTTARVDGPGGRPQQVFAEVSIPLERWLARKTAHTDSRPTGYDASGRATHCAAGPLSGGITL